LSCPSISGQELDKIGELIFMNEGGGKVENLTAWNEGEGFASLGIGHFIWFPKGKEFRFFETFPVVVEYMKERGAELPEWMEEMQSFDLPWYTREEFFEQFHSEKMESLRRFLQDTIPLQTQFMAERLRASLPKILETAPEESRKHIKTQYYRVVNSPMGMYVLIDYVNFKGEGTSKSERYNGKGWGLLQVLQNMKGEEAGHAALGEFAKSAEFVLVRRVSNSPPERGLKRWIPGWKNRLSTYTNQTLLARDSSPAQSTNDKSPPDYESILTVLRDMVCTYY